MQVSSQKTLLRPGVSVHMAWTRSCRESRDRSLVGKWIATARATRTWTRRLVPCDCAAHKRRQALADEHAPGSALFHHTETRRKSLTASLTSPATFCAPFASCSAVPNKELLPPVRASSRELACCARTRSTGLLRHVSDHPTPTETRHWDVCYPDILTCICIFGAAASTLTANCTHSASR